MRKLKLSPDTLKVESFRPSTLDSRGGTVAAHAGTEYSGISCGGSYNTCFASCGGTCTCPPTDYSACGCATWETCPGAGICA